MSDIPTKLNRKATKQHQTEYKRQGILRRSAAFQCFSKPRYLYTVGLLNPHTRASSLMFILPEA